MRRRVDNIRYPNERQLDKQDLNVQKQEVTVVNGPEKQQALSRRENERSERKIECLTPIQVPRTLRYLDTFNSIEDKIQKYLQLPESFIPLETIMDNQNLANILGTAALIQQKPSHQPGPSYQEMEQQNSTPRNQRKIQSIPQEVFDSLRIPGESEKKEAWTDDSDFFVRRPVKSQFF